MIQWNKQACGRNRTLTSFVETDALITMTPSMLDQSASTRLSAGYTQQARKVTTTPKLKRHVHFIIPMFCVTNTPDNNPILV